MPARNSVKIYVTNSFYHIYNRGVEKRNIFEDEQDYKVFLNYLKESLSSPPNLSKTVPKIVNVQGRTFTFKAFPHLPKNFLNEIELLAFCLMPNHFHLLIRQNDKDSIKKFMQSLLTRYSLYFNKKYQRVGSLFQGKYKAVIVKDESYILHLSRYIHLNPSEYTQDLINTYSSYAYYLGIRKASWVKPNFILSFFDNKVLPLFKKFNDYKDFVEKYAEDSKEVLGNLTLED